MKSEQILPAPDSRLNLKKNTELRYPLKDGKRQPTSGPANSILLLRCLGRGEVSGTTARLSDTFDHFVVHSLPVHRVKAV